MITLLAVLFAAAGAYALWRARPSPMPWHAIGSERMVTPALDIADETTRSMLRSLRDNNINRFDGAWLGDVCSGDRMSASEVYVLSRGSIPVGGPMHASRVVVLLGNGGESTFEQFRSPFDRKVISRERRSFDDVQAEVFRSLLVDGGYARMTDPGVPGRCDGEIITLESCVHGRYFGIVRACEADEIPALRPLAAAIENFAGGRTAP